MCCQGLPRKLELRGNVELEKYSLYFQMIQFVTEGLLMHSQNCFLSPLHPHIPLPSSTLPFASVNCLYLYPVDHCNSPMLHASRPQPEV